MKKNIAIVILLTIVGLYFFGMIGSDKKEPEVVNSNIIKFHTHSLYGIEGGLFKINHETGETHYFSGGVFVPVPTVTYDQLRGLQKGESARPMSNHNKANQLLEQF